MSEVVNQNEEREFIPEDVAKQIVLERERKLKELESLNKKEDDEPITSLGKAKMIEEKEQRRIETRELAAEIGWKNIPFYVLPSEGKFYPEGTSIAIRSASVQEIRHFSSIEEEDLIDIDDKLNFIIDKCCRIRTPRGMGSFKDIVEIDRFTLIFAIREISFKDGENKLQMNFNCNQCGNSDLISIDKNNFAYFKLDEKLVKFYDPASRKIKLVRKDGEEIYINIPTLGVTNYIKNLIRMKSQKNEFFDKTFLKVAPFLFDDWRAINDTTYNKKNDDTFTWDLKKMSLIVQVIDLLQKSTNPNVNHTCSACGAEVSAPLSFQGGIKSLFLIPNELDELL